MKKLTRRQVREMNRYIRNVTNEMERAGYLEIKIENGHRMYQLTEAGQKQYITKQGEIEE